MRTGHEHDSLGNSCTSLGSTVPRMVKTPSFMSKEMPPDAMTDAARSAIDAAYAADGSADDDDVAWSAVSVDAADYVDGDDANAEEVNVCPLL